MYMRTKAQTYANTLRYVLIFFSLVFVAPNLISLYVFCVLDWSSCWPCEWLGVRPPKQANMYCDLWGWQIDQGVGYKREEALHLWRPRGIGLFHLPSPEGKYSGRTRSISLFIKNKLFHFHVIYNFLFLQCSLYSQLLLMVRSRLGSMITLVLGLITTHQDSGVQRCYTVLMEAGQYFLYEYVSALIEKLL